MRSSANVVGHQDPELADTRRRLLSALPAAVLLVSVCLPYLALPIFASTGLQAAEVVVVLLALRCGHRAGWRTLWCYYLLVATTWASGLGSVLTDGADVGLVLKNCLVFSVVLLAVPAAGSLSKGHLATVGVAILAVSVLHLAVAAWQISSFRHGSFPGLTFYDSNPSFASYRNIAVDYAVLVHRPFGWLPEPSAMAATLGPWAGVVVLIAVRDRRRWVLGVGLLSANLIMLLVILSGTGYVVFLLLALSLTALGLLMPQKAKFVRRRRTVGVALLTGVGISGSVGVLLLLTRVHNSTTSYQSRWLSIRQGLALMLDRAPWVGLGPGRSSGQLAQSGVLVVDQFGSYAPNAIDSVLLRYVAETGVFGAVVWCLVAWFIGSTLLRSAEPLAGLAVAISVFTALIATTSYLELLSPWLVIGILLQWDRLFPHDAECSTS